MLLDESPYLGIWFRLLSMRIRQNPQLRCWFIQRGRELTRKSPIVWEAKDERTDCEVPMVTSWEPASSRTSKVSEVAFGQQVKNIHIWMLLDEYPSLGTWFGLLSMRIRQNPQLRCWFTQRGRELTMEIPIVWEAEDERTDCEIPMVTSWEPASSRTSKVSTVAFDDQQVKTSTLECCEMNLHLLGTWFGLLSMRIRQNPRLRCWFTHRGRELTRKTPKVWEAEDACEIPMVTSWEPAIYSSRERAIHASEVR
jgi:hypothetical protein